MNGITFTNSMRKSRQPIHIQVIQNLSFYVKIQISKLIAVEIFSPNLTE